MENKDVQKLCHGVYRLYWDEESYSLASVGSLHDGDRWFACTNWTTSKEGGKLIGFGSDWLSVEKVELIEANKITW